MIGFLVDILLLATLAFCVWQGLRKGLILSAARVLTLILGVIAGAGVAGALTGTVTETLTPLLEWVADDATDAAVQEFGRTPDARVQEDVAAVSKATFEKLGVLGGATDGLAQKVWAHMLDTGAPLRASIASVFIDTVWWVILFLFGFAVITLLLTLALHFLSMLLTLPPLPKQDRIGGIAAGALYGLMLIFVVTWVLRFLGIIVPREFVDNTLVLRLFVHVNPFGAILF